MQKLEHYEGFFAGLSLIVFIDVCCFCIYKKLFTHDKEEEKIASDIHHNKLH